MDRDGARQWDLQQVRKPPRRRFLRHGAEVHRFLQRAVGVAQKAPVACVDADRLGAAGDGVDDLLAVRGGRGGAVGLHDLRDLVELVEVGQCSRGGVQALPQDGERFDGPGDVRVDAQADEQAGDLLGVVQAVARGALVRLPAGAVLGSRRRACRLEALFDRDFWAPGDGDPVARLDGGLLAGGRGADRLALGLQEAPAGAREVLAGRVGGEVVGDRAGDTVLVFAHRVVDRDRVDLGVEREALVVGDRGEQARPRRLDRLDLAGVGGDRVGHVLAVDDPHVGAVAGDDQAVGLERGDVDQLAERGDAPVAACRAPRRRCQGRGHAGCASSSSDQSPSGSSTSTSATGTVDSSTPPGRCLPARPPTV